MEALNDTKTRHKISQLPGKEELMVVNELPQRLAASYGDIRIAPDMRSEFLGEKDRVYTAVGTEELEQIVEGLEYYARRLHQLKLCVQNAHSVSNECSASTLRIIKFSSGA
jgi:hypothetical protein